MHLAHFSAETQVQRWPSFLGHSCPIHRFLTINIQYFGRKSLKGSQFCTSIFSDSQDTFLPISRTSTNPILEMSDYAPTIVMSMNSISSEPSYSMHSTFGEGPNLAFEQQQQQQLNQNHSSNHHFHHSEDDEFLISNGMTSSQPIQRVQLACLRCRKQKLKCDGGSPSCSRCLKRDAECVYSNEPTGRKNGSKKKAANKLALSSQKSSKTDLDMSFTKPFLPKKHNLIALEQLSQKLTFELDSYTSIAQHWQRQLKLLNTWGPDAVTDPEAVALVRKFRPPPPPQSNTRPSYIPTNGTPWMQASSSDHPSIFITRTFWEISTKAAVSGANSFATLQDPNQVDIRCHRFRIMKFWDLPSPKILVKEDVPKETLMAVWDILLQPIKTVVTGNAFVDEIGRPLEDDIEETQTIDSIALFGHTSTLDELLRVMELGVIFYFGCNLADWIDQAEHLAVSLDRLLHIAFFQREMSTRRDLADRNISFLMWYVWRYKACKMNAASRTVLSLAYQTLLSNFDHVSPDIAASLNIFLITTASTRAQILHHVKLAERIPQTNLKKALMCLAIAISTLSLPGPVATHIYEEIEADYPELLRVISTIHNPFDPGNHAIQATALFLHAETLVRLGREVGMIESLIKEAVADVVENQASNAIHILFSNLFMFKSTIQTVVQFSNGIFCTVADFARIELAEALGFPLKRCEQSAEESQSGSPCKLVFSDEIKEVLLRMGKLKTCDGSCSGMNRARSPELSHSSTTLASPTNCYSPSSSSDSPFLSPSSCRSVKEPLLPGADCSSSDCCHSATTTPPLSSRTHIGPSHPLKRPARQDLQYSHSPASFSSSTDQISSSMDTPSSDSYSRQPSITSHHVEYSDEPVHTHPSEDQVIDYPMQNQLNSSSDILFYQEQVSSRLYLSSSQQLAFEMPVGMPVGLSLSSEQLVAPDWNDESVDVDAFLLSRGQMLDN